MRFRGISRGNEIIMIIGFVLTAGERISVNALGCCRLQRVPPLPLWQHLADQYNWRLPEERLSRQHFISAVSCTYCRSFSTTLKGKNGQCFSDELIRIEREFQAVGLGHANALVLARRGLFRVLPSNHWHRSRQLLACQRSRKWV